MTCRVARLSTVSRDAAKPAPPVADANSPALEPDRPEVWSAGASVPAPQGRDLEPARSA